ncbi:hypothetical protein EI94DRAFT_1723712 [Lactarius quietus]|nr:hypothetical protein EI94DRAFT_1723712 [Lactarius quietus]
MILVPCPLSRPNLISQPEAGYAMATRSSTPHKWTCFAPATSDYGPEPFANHPRAGPSTASLISSRRESSTSTFDDSAHLTASIPPEPPDVGNWRTSSEHAVAATLRSQRRTPRQSTDLSPLSRSGTTIKLTSFPRPSPHLSPCCQLCHFQPRR